MFANRRPTSRRRKDHIYRIWARHYIRQAAEKLGVATPTAKWKWRQKKPRDAVSRDCDKTTSSVGTPNALRPPRSDISGEGETRDDGKPTMRAATKHAVTSNWKWSQQKLRSWKKCREKNVIFRVGEPRDNAGHGVGTPMPVVASTNVATQNSKFNEADSSFGTPYNMSLANGSRASQGIENTEIWQRRSSGILQIDSGGSDENSHDAERREVDNG